MQDQTLCKVAEAFELQEALQQCQEQLTILEGWGPIVPPSVFEELQQSDERLKQSHKTFQQYVIAAFIVGIISCFVMTRWQ